MAGALFSLAALGGKGRVVDLSFLHAVRQTLFPVCRIKLNGAHDEKGLYCNALLFACAHNV
jgi:hypothetical protein